jgi:hypothetical protein
MQLPAENQLDTQTRDRNQRPESCRVKLRHQHSPLNLVACRSVIVTDEPATPSGQLDRTPSPSVCFDALLRLGINPMTRARRQPHPPFRVRPR